MQCTLPKPRALALALAAAFAPLAFAEGEQAANEGATILPWAGADAKRQLTEVSSSVQAGVLHVGGTNTYTGSDYTGLESGNHLILDIDLRKRSENGGFANIVARNLGLDSREVSAEAGVQGNFRLSGEYTRIPHRITDEAMTIFNGVGSNQLSLPAGWVAGADLTKPAMRASVNANLHSFELGTDRERFSFSAEKLFGAWELSANVKHEIVKGTKLTGGLTAGRAVLLPEPIDYTTDELTLTAAYNSERYQFELSYLGSLFGNEYSNLNWRNPFTATNANAGYSANPLTGVAAIGMPPDNQMHQLSAQLAARLTDTTRLTTALLFQRATQDETFQPYTVNTLLTVGTPLPRSSLDGQVDTTIFTLGLNSRPLPKLTVNASYRYHDHSNETPQAQYRYVPADGANQGALNTQYARVNLPLSWTHQTFKLDATYRLPWSTRLLGGYEWADRSRTFSDIGRENENTYKLELSASPLEALQGGIGVTQSTRKVSEYDTAAAFGASYSPQYLATLPANAQYDNLPALRKFNTANRDRTKLRAFATATPHKTVTLTLSASMADDDYSDSPVGLTSAKVQSYTVDLGYNPTEAITASAWYSHEKYDSDQTGRSFSSAAATKAAQAADPARNWYVNSSDRTDTFGIGLKGRLTRRIELAADYTQSHSRSRYDVSTATNVLGVVSPFPDADADTRSLNLSAAYKARPDTTLRLAYVYQKLDWKDWLWDGVTPTTIANVLTTGQGTPDYKLHGIGVSLDYRFY